VGKNGRKDEVENRMVSVLVVEAEAAAMVEVVAVIAGRVRGLWFTGR